MLKLELLISIFSDAPLASVADFRSQGGDFVCLADAQMAPAEDTVRLTDGDANLEADS